MPDITVHQAAPSQIDDLADLFDAYRVFYGQPSDTAAAGRFLAERFDLSDSVILLAEREGVPVGFAQLYPTLSSVAMKRVWVLNDLFVTPQARRSGVGQRLLQAAAEYAEQTGAARLSLSTARDNHTAKALYEKAGWSLDRVFDHYNLAVRSEP